MKESDRVAATISGSARRLRINGIYYRRTLRIIRRHGAINIVRNMSNLTLFSLLFAAALLLSACTDPQRALAPPNADVSGIQTVVVFPLSNQSREGELEKTIVNELTEQLRAVGWYDVIGPDRVAPLLGDLRIDAEDIRPDSAAWLETAREIAMELDADGFVTGSVLEYTTNVMISSPYRGEAATGASPAAEADLVDLDTPDGSADQSIEWFVDQTTEAKVVVRGQLVNVHTGVTVYERTATGRGRVTDARQLNWSTDQTPPESLIPTPHRRDIDSARTDAVEAVLNAFTADILPQTVRTDGQDG